MNKKLLLFFLINAGLLVIDSQVIAQVSDYEKANIAFNRGDYKTSYNLIKPLAKKGVAQAQYSLGIMYEKGKGVVLNLKKAKKWFKLAAQQGISKAQYKLGLMYRNGKGGEKNYSKAIKWWELAANRGNNNAQIKLGLIFENGLEVPQDYNKAIRLYSLAAGAGNTKAQKYLNSLLNKKVEAQINFSLGVRFETGQGVLRDYNEAIRWYNLAANLGFDKGKEKRDLLRSKMKNSKEIRTGAKDFINIEEEKNHQVKDLKVIQQSLQSLKGQIKPEKIVETANLADIKTRQEKLQKPENNNLDSNVGNISIPADEFDTKYSKLDKMAKADDSIKLEVNTSKLECNSLNNITKNLECAKHSPERLIKEKVEPNSIKMKQTFKSNSEDLVSKIKIFEYLKKWARAWENHDIESYFSFYSEKFTGLKNRHLDWKNSRQLAFNKNTNIFIDIKNIQIFNKNDVAKTSFIQTFKSDNYSDIGIKEIFWVKYGPDWRITSEIWFPIRK
ncbi:sel1 repeat family protein [Patescibacteria group bacterium]|nr:sel1 repeat family protein [Patescibacteria group bacterium]